MKFRRRVVDQDIEKVVIPHLENLGRNLHADGIALAQIEINVDLHSQILSHHEPSVAPATTIVDPF